MADLKPEVEVIDAEPCNCDCDVNVYITDTTGRTLVAVDATYNPDSARAQAGTAVAQAVAPLATKADLHTHTDNGDMHVTVDNKNRWNDTYTRSETDSKLATKADNSALQSQVAETKEELEQLINNKVEAALHYKGQVSTKAELPQNGQLVGDMYNVEDSGANYAWSGTVWDKLSENISGLASKAELSTHANNTDIHVSTGEKDKWNNSYSRQEVDAKITHVTEQVEQVETYMDSFIIDQRYNSKSEHPQSGYAVAEAIEGCKSELDLTGLATKAELGDLASKAIISGDNQITTVLFFATADAAPPIGSRNANTLYLIGE